MIQLFGENSSIDSEILKVQKKKDRINSELMEPVFRGPDDGPDLRHLNIDKPLSISVFDEFR